MKRKLVFATNNAHKLEEVSAILGDKVELLSLNDINCHTDIPETAETLEGNAYLKSSFIYRNYGLNCFADDTGLEVESLGGAPGIYSARYAGGEGHNAEANMLKLLHELEGKELLIYNIGRKGHEALERKGYEIAEDYSEVINSPLYSDAVEISQRVLKDFEEEKIGEIYLVYTSFKNTVVHEPKLLKLLPVEFSDKELSDAERNTPMNYKPGEEEALDMIIPKYIASLLYGALNEAAASENGARMQAMDAATSNAEDMMESLELQYNRARQGSITQELTEIIAGAEAVE